MHDIASFGSAALPTAGRPGSRVARRCVASLVACAFVVAAGCRSTSGYPELTDDQLAEALVALSRDLPGDPAALYRLRVPSTGGLRLALSLLGDRGRMSVSEPFGSAVSLTAWTGDADAVHLDLRDGCREESSTVSTSLGVGRLPLPQAVRLLTGRLPAVESDTAEIALGGLLKVRGDEFTALARVVPGPWRVVEVEVAGRLGAAWRVELGRHTESVPRTIRIEERGGEWAELELVRLEWDVTDTLPPLPELPPCADARSARQPGGAGRGEAAKRR